jgi:hypothetical protein
MHRFPSIVAVAASWLWVAQASGAGADTLASAKFGTWGFDASGMDHSVAPGANFDQYAQWPLGGQGDDPARPQTLRSTDGWYQAFGIKPGDPLYIGPKDRVHIW